MTEFMLEGCHLRKVGFHPVTSRIRLWETREPGALPGLPWVGGRLGAGVFSDLIHWKPSTESASPAPKLRRASTFRSTAD